MGETAKLPDEFEDLGPEPIFSAPGFQIRPSDGSSRVQIISPDDERMIQVQDSRFVYNWRKRSGGYPSYTTIKPEFDRVFGLFNDYLRSAALPSPQPNQWEMHYVNQIPKGKLWESVSDWEKIFPGFYTPPGRPKSAVEFETAAGVWRYRLQGNRGRLHISMQHGRMPEGEKSQVILLQLIARGPIIDGQMSADDGFSAGHAAIVNTFHGMTSATAHTEWKEGD